MIPSRNEGIAERALDLFNKWEAARQEQAKDPEAFAKKHGLPDTDIPKEINFTPDINVVCDCCGKSCQHYLSCFLPPGKNPYSCSDDKHYADREEGFIRVLDKIYYGCRAECATALFMIHHQYAMREKPQ